MQEAIDTGVPYQTLLDPAPGPPCDEQGNFIPMSQWDPDNWPSHIHPPREEDKIKTVAVSHAGYEMFNKAAFAAHIVSKCHDDRFRLGHVKLAKLYYLSQRCAGIKLTEEFIRQAAGPWDEDMFKFLSLAQKQGWLDLPEVPGDFKPVLPGTSRGKATEQVSKKWGEEAMTKIDEMLEKMKTWSMGTLERWATVDAVSQDIVKSGKTVNVETVKEFIGNEPIWSDKLDREEFSDDNIASTLRGLRMFGLLSEENP